jgi:hypothetical protein
MKQVTMESVKQRIADLESAGKVVGGLSLSSEFELGCLRELVAVTEQRDALVVENVGLLRFGDKLNDMRNNLTEKEREFRVVRKWLASKSLWNRPWKNLTPSKPPLPTPPEPH